MISPILAHRASLLITSTCFCRDKMQIPEKRLQQRVWCFIEPNECVHCVQRSCENEPLVNMSNLSCAVHVFNLNDYPWCDQRPIKINSVGSGNVSHVVPLVFNDYFGHSFHFFENIKRRSHARNVRLRCRKIETAKWTIVSNLFLGFALFWTLLRPWADGSNTSIGVSQKLNAGIPSIRRPASNEITSAAVLLCETAVCFLHDHEIGRKVWLPNVHNTLPDEKLKSVKSPLHPEVGLICRRLLWFHHDHMSVGSNMVNMAD